MKKNTSYKSVYPTALKRFFSLIFIAVLTSLSGIAATINSSAGGGNWNSTASWTPAQIPVAGDVVIISGGNITITANAACADITINAGKTLTMNGGNSFDVSGNWVNNGTFSPACCGGVTTVTMTGAGKSIGGSSASTFYNLVINPGAGNTVSLATGNMNIMNGGTLTLQSGIFKPGSANTLTFMNGGNTTINASGGGNFANALNGYTDADGGTILMAGSSGNNLNLTSTAGNILQLNNIMTAGTSDGNWRLNTTVAGSVRINGALTIPLGGGSNQWAASGNPPIWGTASTFYINKNGQQYTPGMEWTASSGTIGVTPGYPNNVTLVNMGNSADNSFIVPGYGNIPVGWKATGAIGLNGTLRIGDGTTPGLASLANVTSFNCGGLIVDDNSRLIGPPTAASFTDRGNFTLQGSSAANTGLFFDAGATITFAGTGTIASPQIVSTTGTTGITFPSMVVNSPSSTYVRLDDPVTVSNTLTLTSGYVGTTNTNILTVGNTASTAITGGSATSYVDGPLAWSLPTTTAGNYKFPIGDGGAGGSYLPLTISSATSAGATVTATAFEANSNGIPDATISSISPTEYWSVSTTTPFTSALVSVSRPTAVAPYNALGESSSVGGVYTTIGGSPSGNSVNNGGLGSQSPEYLTLVNAFLNAVKLGSTNAGVDASCNPVNGSLTVGGVGGTPPYTFSMDGSAFTATTTYNNLTKGNHTVIIKDNTGATSTTIMKVLGPVQINGDDKDLNYCNTGPAVVLTASNLLNGSPTYSWSPGGQTTASISVTPAVATTYTVTSQVLIPGSNLLTGGSFESGLPTGMSGGFTANGGGYGTTPDPGGYYKIGTAGNQLCTFFTALPAQSGTQYYIADGNKNGNALVFNLSLASYGIVAGQTYTFSYWYAEGSNHPNKATLRTTFANGTLISGSGDITTANYGGWLQASYTFTATTTSPTISLTDIAVFGSTNGDDFYLDNLQLIHLNSCPLTTSVTVTPGCPLPVELVNFDATKKGSDALLTWTTSSEKNSLYFLVEKSSDGISFTGIGKVNAAGNTSAIQQYSFTDQNLASGVTYYRLAQYDVDGSVYYSMIKAVSNMVGTVQVIPNPNNGTFVVALDHTGNKKTHVRIVNSLGQVVYENTVSSDSVMNVDISLLASAVYYLEVITDEDLIVKKIVKE